MQRSRREGPRRLAILSWLDPSPQRPGHDATATVVEHKFDYVSTSAVLGSYCAPKRPRWMLTPTRVGDGFRRRTVRVGPLRSRGGLGSTSWPSTIGPTSTVAVYVGMTAESSAPRPRVAGSHRGKLGLPCCDVSGRRAHLCWDIVPCSGRVLGLVVAAGVEGEFAEQLAVFGHHLHVKVGDQDQDPSAGVPAAQPDVVQPAVVAKGDHAAVVDLARAEEQVEPPRPDVPSRWGRRPPSASPRPGGRAGGTCGGLLPGSARGW